MHCMGTVPQTESQLLPLTCASVDEETDDHADRHHPAPGLYLRPLHAVEHGHAAHMALPGREQRLSDRLGDASTV